MSDSKNSKYQDRYTILYSNNEFYSNRADFNNSEIKIVSLDSNTVEIKKVIDMKYQYLLWLVEKHYKRDYVTGIIQEIVDLLMAWMWIVFVKFKLCVYYFYELYCCYYY